MKRRVEFDMTLPSGPLCRIFRLERDDLIRMNVQEYLDTFSPLLLEDALSPEEQPKQMTDAITEHPKALTKMFVAIGKMVMACTVKRRSEDESKAKRQRRLLGKPQFHNSCLSGRRQTLGVN
jgi:hypothetical protein